MRKFCCCAFQVEHVERYTHRNDSIIGFISTRVLFSTSTVEHPRCTNFDVLDLRSPRSDAPCRGGDRQGANNRLFSLGVNTGFTQLLDILC